MMKMINWQNHWTNFDGFNKLWTKFEADGNLDTQEGASGKKNCTNWSRKYRQVVLSQLLKCLKYLLRQNKLKLHTNSKITFNLSQQNIQLSIKIYGIWR